MAGHGIIMTIIIGFIIGIIAKFLMPGRDPAGFFITVIIGIAGSFAATFLGKALGLYQPGEAAGFIGSVIGAMLLLFVYHMIRRKSA